MKNRNANSSVSASALIVIAVTLLLAGSSAQAGSPNPGVLPVNSTPYGKTYGEWSAKWWQWDLSLPATAHPLFDTADCSAGQSGQVWFLGGKSCATPAPPGGCNANLAERTCTVPHGKALFFPIINAEDSVIEENNGFGCGPTNPTETDLRNCAAFIINGVTDLLCEIDGRAVNNLDSFRVQSPLFTFTLASHDNLLAAVGEAGTPDGASSQSVSDGIYVMLAPLSAGAHTLHFHGRLTCAFCGNFNLDITYHLTVE